MAHGQADDFLSTMLLATTATVIVAPAMNVNMWNHPATRANIALLLDRFPPRRIILPCIIVFAAALASLSRLTPSIRQFYFTFFILGVVGNGTAQLAYSRAVLTWFRERRGMALALTLTGSGTGSILIPQIVHVQPLRRRSGYLATA